MIIIHWCLVVLIDTGVYPHNYNAKNQTIPLTNDDTIAVGDLLCVEPGWWCGGDPDNAQPSHEDHCSPKVCPQVSLQSRLQVSIHNSRSAKLSMILAPYLVLCSLPLQTTRPMCLWHTVNRKRVLAIQDYCNSRVQT